MSKKIIGIGVIFLVVILGVSVFVLNSDSYKINKSVDLFCDGEYNKALMKIQDVYTPQAQSIVSFVDVQRSVDDFLVSALNDDIEISEEKYTHLYSVINNFDEKEHLFYLPEELKEKYYCYRYAINFTSKSLNNSQAQTNKLSQAFYNVQLVMMNEVTQKRSSKDETFTFNLLQARVNSSKNALKELEKYSFPIVEVDDSNVILYCKTSSGENDSGNGKNFIFISDELNRILETLYEKCSAEVISSQENIDKNLKKHAGDARVYITKPNYSYASYVGPKLKPIVYTTDITTNEITLMDYLERDYMYYLITGKTIDQNEG
ncbi:MAG: hypothetical protein IJ262_04245 [Clostridia bacterium]|nr:hypothetical protein [Clostridia bacterium]